MKRAFCSWPGTLPIGNDGNVSQLVQMLPEQCQRELASMVTSLPEALSELAGATPRFAQAPGAVGADFVLP